MARQKPTIHPFKVGVALNRKARRQQQPASAWLPQKKYIHEQKENILSVKELAQIESRILQHIDNLFKDIQH